MTTETFLKLGNIYMKNISTISKKTNLRRFKSFFGIVPPVCSIIWKKIKYEAPSDSHPKHLLWCLYFLKQYSVEHTRRALFNSDEKTVRKWTWIFVKLLADLNVIHWEKRFDAAVSDQTCFCSLDGVDFKILEPTPFSRQWYSHKFRGPGLRYEIALNIRTGHIVWKHGGYPCGEFPDLKLARDAYVLSVNPGELTLSDKGYRDKQFFVLPTKYNSGLHKLIMSRHETVNKRIKQFKILKETFRNSLEKHPIVFHAVTNLTQMMIENGEPLFSVI